MSAPPRFEGFPARTEFTAIPNPFFSSVLPDIDDLAELKLTLYIFWALYRKKGYPRFITLSELRADHSLMAGLKGNGTHEESLRRGLDGAVERGTLLRLKIEREGEAEHLFFLNTEQDRRAIDQIEDGEIDIGGTVQAEPASTEERSNIFALYEQHVGLLTPMIAEELKEAEVMYPATWIEDAFREAVNLNKRNWRYISRILERWSSEGRSDGRTREDSKADIDPGEFLRKYGRPSGK